MQNKLAENEKENENENNENIAPQHFSNTASNNNSPATATTRTQNFSFASTYQPSTGHFLKSEQNENDSFNSKLSNSTPTQTAFNLSKPIASFSVLKPDEFYEPPSFVGSKPNAIVRPIRRSEQPNLPGGRQYGQQQQQQQQQENDTDSTHTYTSQPYQYQLSGSSVTQPPPPRLPPSYPSLNYAHNFAELLDRKLRYLHSRDNYSAEPNWRTTGYRRSPVDVCKHAKGKSTANSLVLAQRPLFITTVPTGIFLPPPKEMPLPHFLRPYVYSSHPMVLSNSHSSNYNKSPTFSKDKPRHSTAPITKGDKDITTTSTAVASSLSSSSRLNGRLQDYAKTLAGGVHLTNEQFRQQIQQHRGKREIHREPYKNIMFDRRVIRGSNFAKTRIPQYSGTSEQSAAESQKQVRRFSSTNGRYKRSLNSTDSHPMQRDEFIQTDEEFFTDIKKKRPEFSVNTQTELIIFPNDNGSNNDQRMDKAGIDVGTEIAEHDELFQQDIEMQTLIEYFVDMCLEESVLELMYEDQMNDCGEKSKAFESEMTTDSKTINQDDTSAAQLLQGHIAKLVPEVLENLESAAYIEPSKKNDVMKTICPWLTVEVAEEVGHIVDSREILTVIIEEIIKQRAAAYGDINKMPEIVANIEEIIEVPSENNIEKENANENAEKH